MTHAFSTWDPVSQGRSGGREHGAPETYPYGGRAENAEQVLAEVGSCNRLGCIDRLRLDSRKYL